jgi:hypothetical protein
MTCLIVFLSLSLLTFHHGSGPVRTVPVVCAFCSLGVVLVLYVLAMGDREVNLTVDNFGWLLLLK